ncbi:MerR family transcriptional regulator [Aquitalea magnusonii]|nr:MerR family transcriptional regulator [Aquitalea magnusonii]
MKIGELATASGLSRDTLRFYEKLGLLRAQRGSNGYRDYPADAVQWLGYVRLAQNLGFTLAEISADLIALSQEGGTPDAVQLRAALQAKRDVIDERIRSLQHLRDELQRRLDAPDLMACPLQVPAGENS